MQSLLFIQSLNSVIKFGKKQCVIVNLLCISFQVLQTKEVGGVTQTGENVGGIIKECMEYFQISGKVSAMTVDNASNMEVAAKAAEILKIGCLSHTLNLASNKVLQCSSLTKLLGMMRPIISFFHKSYVGAKVLLEKQKALSIPKHKLINDCKTRWNSTYLMVNINPQLCNYLFQNKQIYFQDA